MAGIILVRHAMPEVEPGVSSSLWRLGERAKEDCVLLAHALPAQLARTVYASDRPKVMETAGVIALRRGLEVRADSRLAEVDQSAAGWIEGDYREVAMRYLATGESPGWEPRELVVRRFGEGIGEALAAAVDDPGEVVVVNHGLAMSLWVASQTTIDVVEWWRALTFPDGWRLDLKSGGLEQVFRAGMAPE